VGGRSTLILIPRHRPLVAVLADELRVDALWNAPVVIDCSQNPPSNVGGFRGKVQTCTYLLKGYHSGTLTHPE
jgi:hypothetical protein